MLNVRIWVEGAVWNMNCTASQKYQVKCLLRIGMQGGRLDADTKENTVLEKVSGRRLRGGYSSKVVDVLSEGRVEVRTRKRRDAVSAI